MRIRTVTLFKMDVGGVRRVGKPVSVHQKTGWFRIMKGAKTSYVIKRHYVKHNVQPFQVIAEEV